MAVFGKSRKSRRTVLSGTKKTVLFDDMAGDEQIRVYDAGVDAGVDALLEYRLGDVTIPRIAKTEALANELKHFRDCIFQRSDPRSSGSETIAIIAVLEAAELSSERDGENTVIDYPEGY